MFDQIRTRRDFLKSIIAGSASFFPAIPFAKSIGSGILTLDPRIRVPNPYVTPEGKPILVCVTGTDYGQMLTAGFDVLGGLGLLLDDNQDILIKPNLVYTEEYPTTSSVGSIVATIQAAREVTSGAIKVGDCGSIDNQIIYDFVGLEGPVGDGGGELIMFSDTYDVRRSEWDPEMPDFVVFSDVYDAPVIINLCSLKRHRLAFMTCAIKHHVGTVSGPDRTDTRDYLHSFPGESAEFLQLVAETGGLINSELTIVDAREIMAVDGPLREMGGEIRPADRIVICGDMVAADAYCALIMAEIDETFNPLTILPTLRRAEELGLGTADLSEVEIIETSQTSVEGRDGLHKPEKFALRQNYPNPFNARTTIEYELREPSDITINIHDNLGRSLEKLVSGHQDAGRYKVAWNADSYPSGVYFARLQAGGRSRSLKMVLMK